MARDRFDDEYDERPWRSRRDDRPRDDDDEDDDRRDYDDSSRRRTRDDEYDGYDDSDYDRRPPQPKNYLVESILVLIFCCWPFAIPALVNAASVQGLWFSGKYRQARQAADRAKMWCWISFGLALGGALLYIFALAFAAVMAN